LFIDLIGGLIDLIFDKFYRWILWFFIW